MATATEHYVELEEGYLPPNRNDELTVHGYLALADFQLRFTTMCAAAARRSQDPFQVKLSRSPGFGAYIAYLKSTSALLKSSSQFDKINCGQVITLINDVLHAVQSGNGTNGQFGTLEKLRNHICHGGPLPEGPERVALTERSKAATEVARAAILNFLQDATASTTPVSGSLAGITLNWPKTDLQLWPFVCQDSNDSWCILWNFTGHLPTYVRRGSREVRIEGRGEELILALTESMVPKSEDRTLPDFINDLRADLSGFRDPDYSPHHHEDSGIVNILWVRATATGDEPRSDSFRLGPDDRREWEIEPGRWAPYGTFLRNIANWPVVATRMRQQLQSIEEELSIQERATLGWTGEKTAWIKPHIEITDLRGVPLPEPHMSFDDLQLEIDSRLSVRGTQTRIYFIAGEAGIGKTRMLINAALSRAHEVEQEEDELEVDARRPLFLYVRSTGQVLNSLQTVVSAAASETRNLNEESIRALCRNGLIALFIDGFDELLGGVGYDDALGSLRSWLQGMGGRGVIVVSARSSYYLNQYRSSLQKRPDNGDISVEHRVSLIRRWTTGQVNEFLRQYDINPAGIDTLSRDDRELLGLPFFARVYAEATRSGGKLTTPLPDLIVDQYLARESAKLIMPGDQNKSLLSTEELGSTFEYITEIMTEQGEREVTLEDLQLSAQMALGNVDLESRRGLANRLSVLCGLAVSDQLQTERRFRFQHELFYDIFLANTILRNLAPGNFDRVEGAMRREQWRSGTASRIARIAPEQAFRLLESINRRPGTLSTKERALFRSNTGILWEKIIQRISRHDSMEIRDATIDRMDFSDLSITSLIFKDCEVKELEIPPHGVANMEFVDCSIESLTVNKQGTPLQAISRFENVHVARLLHPGALIEKQSEIARDLRTMGAPLPPPSSESTPILVEAATFYLEKIQARADSLFIMKKGYKSADENVTWWREYGEDIWVEFVKALEESEAVALVSQSASGATIQRVKFTSSVQSLLNHDSEDDAVTLFWELVKERR